MPYLWCVTEMLTQTTYQQAFKKIYYHSNSGRKLTKNILILHCNWLDCLNLQKGLSFECSTATFPVGVGEPDAATVSGRSMFAVDVTQSLGDGELATSICKQIHCKKTFISIVYWTPRSTSIRSLTMHQYNADRSPSLVLDFALNRHRRFSDTVHLPDEPEQDKKKRINIVCRTCWCF